MKTLCASLVVLPVLALACGSSTPAPAGPAADASGASKPHVPDAASSAPKPADKHDKVDAPKTAAEEHVDPNEASGPIALVPLWGKKDKPKFPKASTGDKECWATINLTGDHEKDYAQLADKCGAPTGSVEYVKAARGRLHHKHDKRDTFTVKLAQGFCYRYFAVGDAATQDLDILIMRQNGDLIGEDKTTSPVAIIHNDKPWCMDEDAEYQFHVEVEGPGIGGYVFAVWARPKK